jgi:hypothetical protein
MKCTRPSQPKRRPWYGQRIGAGPASSRIGASTNTRPRWVQTFEVACSVPFNSRVSRIGSSSSPGSSTQGLASPVAGSAEASHSHCHPRANTRSRIAANAASDL